MCAAGRPCRVLGRFAGVALGLAAAWPAAAEPRFSGRIQLGHEGLWRGNGSVEDRLGERHTQRTNLTGRAIVRDRWGSGFSAAAHLQTKAEAGDEIGLQRRLSDTAVGGLAPDPDAFAAADLSTTLHEDGDARLSTRIDRLFVSFRRGNFVLRAGRQAISWGHGRVFRPMDLFRPFSPTDSDTVYKRGVDAFYAQRLFANGSDVHVVLRPRRDPRSGDLEADKSAAAVKWRGRAGRYGIETMIARDFRSVVGAVAVSGSLARSIWNVVVVPTYLQDRDETKISSVANIRYASTWNGRNYSLFAEYYRNGFGSSKESKTLSDLDRPLVDRLRRRQLFNIGRDYVTAGFGLNATPLLRLEPLFILNANDKSYQFQLVADYEVANNINVIGEATAGFGDTGTEFGGIPTGSGTLAADDRISVRLEWFF